MIDTSDVHSLMIGAAGVGKIAYWLYPCIEYACASRMSFLSTPYAIWQAVYSLIDDGIVQYDSNNKGYISDIIDFYDAVDNLPNSISELLEKRWNSLIKK